MVTALIISRVLLLVQVRAVNFLRHKLFCLADEGTDCLNTVEAAFIVILALTLIFSALAIFLVKDTIVGIKQSMTNLLDKNIERAVRSQRDIERKSYEILVHYWVDDDDHYISNSFEECKFFKSCEFFKWFRRFTVQNCMKPSEGRVSKRIRTFCCYWNCFHWYRRRWKWSRSG